VAETNGGAISPIAGPAENHRDPSPVLPGTKEKQGDGLWGQLRHPAGTNVSHVTDLRYC
jgi:hypothetical protein